MRRIVLWLLSTVSVLVLLFGYNTSTGGGQVASSATSIISGSSATTADTATTATTATATTTVTGDVASTEWGPVQVQLTIAKDAVTRVNVLQYPSGNPKDTEINNYALPILIQETLDQQSAGIDMVSGATVTSNGYVQSLQSALDQAGL